MDMIADIGATNTRCALLDDNGKGFAIESYRNADFSDIPGLLKGYIDHRRASDRPRRAALAIAAPILGDEVHMTNIDWRFSQMALREKLGLAHLVVVNDFAAIAWALPQLEPPDLHKLGGGASQARAAMAALGPGSGTGVCALVPAAHDWAVVSGEGGHVTLAAETEEEQRVVELIRAEHGRCSLERVLSGPGLVNLYTALARLAGRGPPSVLPADVTSLALQGEPTARRAVAMFFAFLGAAAGDLAMMMGAQGGVFIAGGIVPRLLDTIDHSEFRARFEAKGRYRSYNAAIPTYVITASLPAFRGLRRLLGY